LLRLLNSRFLYFNVPHIESTPYSYLAHTILIYLFTYSVMLKAETMIPRVVGKYGIDYRCSALREEKIRYTPNVTVQDHHLRPQQAAPSLSEAEAEGSECDMGQK